MAGAGVGGGGAGAGAGAGANGRRWAAVNTPNEMKAGDMLVYCPKPGVYKQGHIVILMEAPVKVGVGDNTW